MAHELSFTNDENGNRKADMFSVIETPWHREGIVLESCPRSTDEAVERANLGYEVAKVGTSFEMTDLDGTKLTTESKKAFVTVRKDRNIELGSVGPDYKVVQNADAFRLTIGPLVEEGILKIETGGALRDGADAWLLGRFDLDRFGPVTREVFADEVVPYALVKVNHSGRRNNEIALTPIRVVCANTLGMVETDIDGGHTKRVVSVRHTENAEIRMVEAAQTLFGGIIERYEAVAKSYRVLKGFYLDEAMLQSLVIEPALGKHPLERARFNPEAKMAESVVDRYERKASEIARLWVEGRGHKGDNSAWEAYNGLVEAVDHNADLFPVRGGVWRTQALMEGTLREMKQNTLQTLVRAANSAAGTPDEILSGLNF